MTDPSGWNPASVLAELLKIAPSKAQILVVGLAVIAAAAIAMTWQIDLRTAGWVAGYIVGFAATLYLLDYILNDPHVKRVLGWFVVTLTILSTTAVFVSSVTPRYAAKIGVEPSYCLIQFWRRCEDVAEDIARRNPIPPAAAAETGPARESEAAAYRVSIRFAGVITRDDVRRAAQTLVREGWTVNQADRGGERTPDAHGVNEVRYGSENDAEAARFLARRINSAGLVPGPVGAVRDSSVPNKNLEVWISR